MEDLIPINIVIGDRSFRVKLAPKDEEVVRKTIKTINDKILEFRTQFAGKDMQDYISMVVLWYATQPGSLTSFAPGDLTESLSRLEKQLDKAMETGS